MLGHVSSVSTTITWLLLEVRQVTWTTIVVTFGLLSAVYMLCTGVTYNVFSSSLKEKSIVRKDEHKLAPIVLVHGVFGFGEGKMGGMPYFGGIENMHQRIFNPDLGALTSLYDRARQLFYYLKGGQVDYGEVHSKANGHSQFGHVYEQGKYSQWDEDNPIHFVGHSAGAQVIRILQQMLANKAFKGYEKTSAKWIASVTTLSGVLNGSTIPYIFGMKPDDWRYAKTTSPLRFLGFVVTIYDWLDIPLLKRYYNFGFDHFHMSRKKTGFWGLVDCLLGKAGPFGSSDWVIPDVTIQGSTKINSQLDTFADTYYFSYAAKATQQVEGKVVPKRMQTSDILSHVHSLWICKWHYPTNVQLPCKDYKDEDWWDNDGQLNTISMTHPRIPIEHPHRFVRNGFKFKPQPGVWYCETVKAYHTQFVLSIQTESHIRHLYDSIFKRCRDLDTERSSQSMAYIA